MSYHFTPIRMAQKEGGMRKGEREQREKKKEGNGRKERGGRK